MKMLPLILLLASTFMTVASAADAPPAPTPANDAQTPALQTARAAGYDAESKIMELELQANEFVRVAKIQDKKNKERGWADPAEDAELRATLVRIQQESRVAKRAIAEGQSADEPEKNAFEAGMADARAGKPRPTVAGDPAIAGADPKDSLQRARAKGHEIATKMVANQNAAKQLMSDVAKASQQNDTSRIPTLQRQLEQLQRTGARLDAEGTEYAKSLTQAERDAFLEGFQAARAGK